MPGRVKTRLLSAITPDQSVILYSAFVADMIEKLQQVSGVDIELHTDGPTLLWDAFRVPMRLQPSGPLELKLLHTLSEALVDHEAVFIIGSDAPSLPVAHVRSMLSIPGDVVLGPAEDGGFWGILCRRLHLRMFHGVDWSSGSEFLQTIQACLAAGLSTAVGSVWWDVDEPADLCRLASTPDVPSRTMAALETIHRDPGMRPHR